MQIIDCEQSLFCQSRLSSAGLERANSRERGKRECEASESRGEAGEKAGKEGERAKFFSEWINADVYKNAKRQEMFFVTSLRLSDHKVSHRIFIIKFRTSNVWNLRNLIKQLFHSPMLDMRLLIANSALRASLAIYDLL